MEERQKQRSKPTDPPLTKTIKQREIQLIGTVYLTDDEALTTVSPLIVTRCTSRHGGTPVARRGVAVTTARTTRRVELLLLRLGQRPQYLTVRPPLLLLHQHPLQQPFLQLFRKTLLLLVEEESIFEGPEVFGEAPIIEDSPSRSLKVEVELETRDDAMVIGRGANSRAEHGGARGSLVLRAEVSCAWWTRRTRSALAVGILRTTKALSE